MVATWTYRPSGIMPARPRALMPAVSRPRRQITLADAVAMMERGVALQGQAVALLDLGAALIARAPIPTRGGTRGAYG